MLHLSRVLAGMIAGLAVASAASAAPVFPARPITVQVAYSPGGSTDRQLRVLAELVSQQLGQPIIVENRPGAGGTMAAGTLAMKGPADGYTLAQAPVSVFRLPHLQQVNWDPLRDFTYVTGLSGYLLGVAVRSDSPFKTWQDVADYARAHPGEVSFASVGIGSTQHLGMTELQRQTGLQLNHIPYKGGAETARALLGGEVTINADAISTLTGLGDKARILMIWEPERSPALPNVPTARELGIDLVLQSPYGLVGPKGMPPDVVQKLHAAFSKALDDPRHLELLTTINQTAWHRNPEEYAAYARQAYKDERRLLENAGLEVRPLPEEKK